MLYFTFFVSISEMEYICLHLTAYLNSAEAHFKCSKPHVATVLDSIALDSV